VPCAPPLTELLHYHLAESGTATDDRLIRDARGGALSESAYGRISPS
jgi:hypothetical protein